MCPVLVVDAGEEQRKIAMQVIGRKCRCIDGLLFVAFAALLILKLRFRWLRVLFGSYGFMAYIFPFLICKVGISALFIYWII